MTVAEYIQLLSQLPPDTKVVYNWIDQEHNDADYYDIPEPELSAIPFADVCRRVSVSSCDAKQGEQVLVVNLN